MRLDCLTFCVDTALLLCSYQYRLIKEGAEPRIAHLQHMSQQHEQHSAALSQQLQQLQLRLEALEQRIANGN